MQKSAKMAIFPKNRKNGLKQGPRWGPKNSGGHEYPHFLGSKGTYWRGSGKLQEAPFEAPIPAPLKFWPAPVSALRAGFCVFCDFSQKWPFSGFPGFREIRIFHDFSEKWPVTVQKVAQHRKNEH